MVVLMPLGLRKSQENGYFKNRKLDIHVAVIRSPRGVAGRITTPASELDPFWMLLPNSMRPKLPRMMFVS